MKTTILKILLIAIITGVYAQERKTIGSIERLMPEMRDFIPDDRELRYLLRVLDGQRAQYGSIASMHFCSLMCQGIKYINGVKKRV